MSAKTSEPRVTKRQINEAARALHGAIAAAYRRVDEYVDRETAISDREEHRAALSLLVQLATKGVEAQP